MENLFISTDNTCDLNENKLRDIVLGIAQIPYFVDNEEFSDETGKSLNNEEFFDKMEKGALTRTSLINQNYAEKFLEKYLKEGKNILHLGLSSGLSGTFENFVKAAEKLNKIYDTKAYIVDSKSASAGLGILIEMVYEKLKQAKTIDEVIDYAKELNDNIAHYFTVDDLKYLQRGGRISKASAVAGTFLNLKPIISFDEKGCLVALTKVISRKKALLKLIDKFKEKYNNQFNKVYVCHANKLKDAEFLSSEIKKISNNVEIDIVKLNFVLGSHCGPGCVAVCFTFDQRKNS